MRIANRRANDAAIEALDVHAEDDILELGFGPGAAIHRLVTLAPLGRIYGIDASAPMVRLAGRRNRTAVREGRVELRQASFDDLPLPDAAVSKILAVNVVYFWEDPQRILAEVRRVLRPGGKLAVYATDAAVMRRWKFAGPDTHHTFDRSALAALLESGGFEPEGIRLRKVRLAPRISPRIYGWVATARKCGSAQDLPP